MVTAISASDGHETDGISQELRERCHENLAETYRNVARNQPHGRIEEEPGVVRIAGGTRPEFNVVFVRQPLPDAVAALDRSASFMARAGVSRWRLQVSSVAASSVETAARAAGFRPHVTMPGMVLLSVPARAPPLPRELSVRRAAGEGLWAALMHVTDLGFGVKPPDTLGTVFPFNLAPVLRGYVGFVARKPVAGSLGLSYRGVGGVYFVSTVPEFRGKGYGTALTWSAIIGARRDGCGTSFLEASELGYPVYSRMGYQKLTSDSWWVMGPE